MSQVRSVAGVRLGGTAEPQGGPGKQRSQVAARRGVQLCEGLPGVTGGEKGRRGMGNLPKEKLRSKEVKLRDRTHHS